MVFKRALRGAVLAIFAVPGSAGAQTLYTASTGAVSPDLVITMNFDTGGGALLNPVVGPNCYLGQTCHFPAGYAGTYMSYSLPDGATATLTHFSGVFKPVSGSVYEVTGRASGTDSAGRHVVVSRMKTTMTITCSRGCTKTYTGGKLTLTTGAPSP